MSEITERCQEEINYSYYSRPTILNFSCFSPTIHIYEYIWSIMHHQSIIQYYIAIKYSQTRSYLARILYHFDIFRTKFIWVKFKESLGNFWQRREFGFFVNILFSIFIFKESLWHKAQLELFPTISPRFTTQEGCLCYMG